jgi:hypothetical protein
LAEFPLSFGVYIKKPRGSHICIQQTAILIIDKGCILGRPILEISCTAFGKSKLVSMTEKADMQYGKNVPKSNQFGMLLNFFSLTSASKTLGGFGITFRKQQKGPLRLGINRKPSDSPGTGLQMILVHPSGQSSLIISSQRLACGLPSPHPPSPRFMQGCGPHYA